MREVKKSLAHYYPRRYDVPLLLTISLGFLLTGLSLPLITVEKTVFWRHWENHYSVFTGVVELAKQGDYALALILFFFSMVFPFIKLLTLLILWVKESTDEERTRALHWLGILGKWSMLDVFAVAILVVAAKLRTLTQIEPRIGVYLFGFAIIFSMLTTMRVDQLTRRLTS